MRTEKSPAGVGGDSADVLAGRSAADHEGNVLGPTAESISTSPFPAPQRLAERARSAIIRPRRSRSRPFTFGHIANQGERRAEVLPGGRDHFGKARRAGRHVLLPRSMRETSCISPTTGEFLDRRHEEPCEFLIQGEFSLVVARAGNFNHHGDRIERGVHVVGESARAPRCRLRSERGSSLLASTGG